MAPTRRWGWIYFTIGVIGALAWARLAGASVDLTDDASLWLNASLFLLLAAFVLEPWYSGSGTTITNSLLVVVGVLAAGFEEHVGWWTLLLAAAVAAFAAMAVSSVFEERLGPTLARRLQRFGRTLGSWRVLPMGLLALALVTFNRGGGDEWNISAAVVVYAFAASTFRIERYFSTKAASAGAGYVGALVAPPAELVVMGDALEGGLGVGALVEVQTKDGRAAGLVVGPTVAEGTASWRLYVPEVRNLLPTGSSSLERNELRVALGPTDKTPTGTLVRYLALLQDGSSEIIGVSVEKSGIAELEVDLQPGAVAEVGDLFVTYRGAKAVYWQVTDGEVAVSAWPHDRRRTVRVSASQLGEWDPVRMRFGRSVVAPPAAEVAVRSVFVSEPDIDLQRDASHVRIGSVPGSNLPVAVEPALLGRHHSAVLGVTGTGKTHLAFSLIDALTSRGTRVLCADLTGQYADRFPDAKTVHYSELENFMTDDVEGPVGISDFTSSGVSPIKQANQLIVAMYDHVKSLPRLDPSEPARFVVVLEEAHNFIPESFVINDWDLKAESQATSKIFMEARKFGLGFIVVTQRTAMVTKSALSQCGSMFVFQSVDQTGHDYLEGMCSRAQVRALPLLPDRTALAMGRALSSDAPLFMKIDDGPASIS